MINIEKLMTQTALNSWKSVNQRVSELIAHSSDADLQKEIAPGRNRVLYLVGHLTAVSDRMFPLLGIGERRFPNLDAVYIGQPDRATADPLAAADLKAAWQNVATRLAEALEAFAPEDWIKKHTAVSDADFAKEPQRNRLAVVLSRTNHISYHLGQLTLAQNPR